MTPVIIVNRKGPEHDVHIFTMYCARMFEAFLRKSLMLSSVLSSDKYISLALALFKAERTCLNNRTNEESLDLLK